MRNKKLITLALAGAMTLGISINAGAADLVNSTPSNADNITVGEDVTQGKVTEYDTDSISKITESTYKSTNSANVYATKASTFSVVIPKTLILDEEGKGSYQIGVKGDISGNQLISVAPNSSFILSEVNAGIVKKPDVTANVQQQKTTFNQSEINNAGYSYTEGSISADITGGSWAGTLTINASMTN